MGLEWWCGLVVGVGGGLSITIWIGKIHEGKYTKSREFKVVRFFDFQGVGRVWICVKWSSKH